MTHLSSGERHREVRTGPGDGSGVGVLLDGDPDRGGVVVPRSIEHRQVELVIALGQASRVGQSLLSVEYHSLARQRHAQ